MLYAMIQTVIIKRKKSIQHISSKKYFDTE